MKQILVFGDSIAYGEGDNEHKGGWVGRMAHKLIERSDETYKVYNFGIPGDTSDDLFERIREEWEKVKFKENDDVIAIIAIGINDSKYYHAFNSNKVPLGEFKRKLLSCAAICGDKADKVILLTPTKVNEALVDPYTSKEGGISFKNEIIAEYASTIKQIAEIQKYQLVDIFAKLKLDQWKTMLVDGAHPNAQGYERLADLVLEAKVV